MNIRTAADLMGATTTSLRPELFDKEILDFSIDSRTTEAGELFFALSQPDYERAGFNPDASGFADAHNYIAGAFTRKKRLFLRGHLRLMAPRAVRVGAAASKASARPERPRAACSAAPPPRS